MVVHYYITGGATQWEYEVRSFMASTKKKKSVRQLIQREHQQSRTCNLQIPDPSW